MKQFTLRLLGFPVVSLDVVELEPIYEGESVIGSGSGHNFTLAEQFVDERFLPWEEEGRSFGFRSV